MAMLAVVVVEVGSGTRGVVSEAGTHEGYQSSPFNTASTAWSHHFKSCLGLGRGRTDEEGGLEGPDRPNSHLALAVCRTGEG
jgi:hypothetical protein